MSLTELPARGRAKRLTPEDVRAKEALNFLARIDGRTDAELGEAAGMSRESFRARCKDNTKIGLADMQRFASLFGVPLDCFAMTRDELIDWIRTDTRGRDLLRASSRCIELVA